MNFVTAAPLTRNLKLLAAVLAVVCATVLTGCGGSDTDDAASPRPAAGGTPGDAAGGAQEGGTGVRGVAKLNGPVPERVVLQTEGDPQCTIMHQDEPLLSDRELISPDGGIQNVFVYVKEAPAGDYPPPAEQEVIDQVACRYIPHVLGVQVGQEISVRNSDPTLHNVRSFARVNRPFNNSQPKGTPPRIKKFDKAEMAIRLKCDIHPWMTAFVFAMDHPFFAVTDAEGGFAISGLPAGEYTLVAWHEKYGEQEAVVTVTEGELATADFTFEAPE